MLFGALQPSAGSAHLQSQPAEGVTFLAIDAALRGMFRVPSSAKNAEGWGTLLVGRAEGWAAPAGKNQTQPQQQSRRTRVSALRSSVVRLRMSDIYVIMSDMASNRITIRIPETLGQRLRHRSRMRGQPESALVREALETYLGQPTEARPAYELAEEAGLIGCIGRGPKSPAKDLSTNPRHLEGFGKSK
jgi:predicted DNA-binding protein